MAGKASGNATAREPGGRNRNFSIRNVKSAAHMLSGFVFAALALMIPPAAFAAPAPPPACGAAFVTRHIVTKAAPGEAKITLEYEFTNKSDLPLVVGEFAQSCGCMIGDWDGKPVPPGGSGKIRALFLTQGLRGVVRKSLTVRFVENGSADLDAEVTIPEAVVYSARTLRWEQGERPVPRVIEVTAGTPKPVRVLSARGDSSFDTALETLEDGRRYRITITPKNTDVERVGTFQVRTDAADPRSARRAPRGLRGGGEAETRSTAREP